jgi:CAAX prenyl protease-like protein
VSEEVELAGEDAEYPYPKDAWMNHVLPFFAWIFFMNILGDPTGWKYALRSIICLAVFCYYKPWQWYPRLNLKNVPMALLIGAFVFGFWVLFETDFMSKYEWLHRGYLTIGTQAPWKISQPIVEMYYAPETCGWLFTITRLLGSALVISFIEEFFWRGWMYRWAIDEKFLRVDLGQYDKLMFLFIAMLFGLIHHRWLVGMICGICYGAFILRTKDVWAAGIAHAFTNFLLGVYVLMAEKYEFWS